MKSAPNFDRVPEELKQLARWVCWRMERGRKVPYDAKLLHGCASTSDPKTWASFEAARDAYEERQHDSDAYSGVGIVLNEDGLVGVDIDHCVVDGVPDPAAVDLLEGLNDLAPEFRTS